MGKNDIKKKNYFDDINMFKKYMEDIENITKLKDITSYNEDEFWNVLLLLCRTYINDNFHRMIEISDEKLLKIIANEAANEEYFFNNTFFDDNDGILNLLFDNQYFRSSIKRNDYKNLFRNIRNNLSHYNYKYDKKKHLVFINDKYNEITISVASLTLFLLAALSCIGQSTKKGSFDIQIIWSNNPSLCREVKLTNLIDNNYFSPTEFFRTKFFQEIVGDALTYKLNEKTKNSQEEREKNQNINEYHEDLKEWGFTISFKPLNKEIMNTIEKYNYSKDEFANLYNMINDDIKRATLMFKLQITILYQLLNNCNKIEKYKNYLDILNNNMIINYLDIVFCDFAINNNNEIIKDLFIKIIPSEYSEIPRKIRNSLAHCHYRIVDITSNSSNVIIEFWDEFDNKKNFECSIFKENIYKLVDEYINNLYIIFEKK